MIDYESYCQIKSLQGNGLTVAQAAEELHIHRQTVAKWYKRERFEPKVRQLRVSILEPFKGDIARLLERHAYSVPQLLRHLRELGYQGGVTVLSEHVAQIRPKKRAAFLTLKFAPGQCAQVDWGSFGFVREGNTQRALSFFVMVLCHSRWMHVEFTLGQSQEWFLACHQRAFRKLGGVPREIMVDNCKTAILSHRRGEAVVVNPHYADFARLHGFTVKACAPRHPQSKGIVENAVGYVKKNFLEGLEIKSFAPLNPSVSLWLDTVANVRKHATTGRQPIEMLAEDRPHLLPLPAADMMPAVVSSVRACSRCRVTIDANRYSVPPNYAGQLLTLQLYCDKIRLLHDHKLITEHTRCFERGKDIESPEHVRELLDQRRHGRRERTLLKFFQLGHMAETFRNGLEERRLNPGQHIERIVALSEIYGEEACSRALADACEFNSYSSEYIANILQMRSKKLPELGTLHLMRASDLLDIEIAPPNLNAYPDIQLNS